MIKSALTYIDAGWHVFPCHDLSSGACSCGQECSTPGKHPRVSAWQRNASNDPEQVRKWWAQWPNANIGGVCGQISGFIVFDLDLKNGKDGVSAFEGLIGEIPRTRIHETGSKGLHVVFRYPEGRTVATSHGKLARGIDVQSDASYVLLPPSVNTAGPYTVVEESEPTEVPDALLALLSERGARTAIVSVADMPAPTAEVIDEALASVMRLAPFVEGENGRGKMLKAASILTHDYGLSIEAAWPIMRALNKHARPPFNESPDAPANDDSLRYNLNQGLKYGKHAIGEERPDAVAERARGMIRAFEGGQRSHAELIALLNSIREIEWNDPAERELIEKELKAVTGLSARVIGLPAFVRAAEPGEIGYVTGANGEPITDAANVVRILEHEKRPIYFDTFYQRTFGPEGEWTDASDRRLLVELQQGYPLSRVTPGMIADGVAAYSEEHKRDALGDWLKHLWWDGTSRIDQFAARAFGCSDNVYTRAAGANFLRGMVARGLYPGTKMDVMLVLEGAQGTFKSTALRTLAGDGFFGETFEDPRSKDFYSSLQGRWLIEVSELAAFSKSDVSAIKAMLSRPVDIFRPPYGRRATQWPRRCVFAGTTNDAFWQSDSTGARRFWPIRCGMIDVDWIAKNREMLFAEASETLATGWHTMPADETRAEQSARNAVHDDPWMEEIARALEGTAETTTQRVYLAVNITPDRQDRRTQMRLVAILRSLGFVRHGSGRGGKITWVKR